MRSYNNLNLIYTAPVPFGVQLKFESFANSATVPEFDIQRIGSLCRNYEQFFEHEIFKKEFSDVEEFYQLYLDFFNVMSEKSDHDKIDMSNFQKSYYTHSFLETLASQVYINSKVINDYGYTNYDVVDISGSDEITYNFSSYSSTINSFSLDKMLSTFGGDNHTLESIPFYPVAIKESIGPNTYVVERSPFKVNVDFEGKKSHARRNKEVSRKQEVWVPWSLYIFNSETNHMTIYFGTGPSSDPDTKYVIATFPNLYSEGSVCWNTSLRNYDFSEMPDLNTHFMTLINEYYSGGWNTDLYSATLSTISYSLRDGAYSDSATEALLNFAKPSQEYFPNYTPSKFEALSKRAESFFDSYSTARRYRYFFEVMSNYDLSQTLSFYSGIANVYVNAASSYETIISRHSSTSSTDNLFKSTYNAISYYAFNNFHEDASISIPSVQINYTNTLFPYVEAVYNYLNENSLTFKELINSSVPEFHYIHLNSQKYFRTNLHGKFTSVAKDFISKLVYNQYTSPCDVIPDTVYASYDFKAKDFVIYDNYEEYEKYIDLLNSNNVKRKELSNV